MTSRSTPLRCNFRGPARRRRRSLRQTRPTPGPACVGRPKPVRISGVGSKTNSGTPSSLESLWSAITLGRKSATAAAMITTSAPGHACARAASMSAALSTSMRVTGSLYFGRQGQRRRGDQGHRRPPAGRRLGERMPLLARGAVGQVAHRIKGLTGTPGAHHHVQPGQVSVRAAAPPHRPAAPSPTSARARAAISPVRPADPRPESPPARRPTAGGTTADAPPLQGGEILPDGRVLPHFGVHGGAHQHRGPGGQQRGGQEVVGRARRRSAPRGGPSPAPPRSGLRSGPSRVCGIGVSSSHREVCAGSEASAEKVTAPTKRVASLVRTGITWAPASTRSRHTSTAL